MSKQTNSARVNAPTSSRWSAWTRALNAVDSSIDPPRTRDRLAAATPSQDLSSTGHDDGSWSSHRSPTGFAHERLALLPGYPRTEESHYEQLRPDQPPGA